MTTSNFLQIKDCDFTEYSNELTIGWFPNQSMAIQVRGVNFELSLTGGYEMAALVFGWHKHCFTFQTGDQIKVGKYAVYLVQYIYSSSFDNILSIAQHMKWFSGTR